MKLSISNILWTKGEDQFPNFLKHCATIGFSGVELALSCFWEEPTHATKKQIQNLKEQIDFFQLEISALHSLTFTREDLELFGPAIKRYELLEYSKRYIEIAEELNCQNIVFGSPKSRKMNGKSKAECDDIFLDFLRDIDIVSANTYVNIEPLNVSTCDYLNTFDDILILLKKETFKNIKIQLDVRTFIENVEALEILDLNFQYVHHCQVSDPGLNLPSSEFSEYHAKTSEILKKNGYSGFVAGEILNRDRLDDKLFLKSAYDSLIQYYG
ncbi:sugar phosphate isomerase/epimerase family protein [Leptospira sp. WS39.C2]